MAMSDGYGTPPYILRWMKETDKQIKALEEKVKILEEKVAASPPLNSDKDGE